MSYSTIPQIGPIKTPPVIKHLIIWTCIISLLSAAIQSIFDQFGLFPGPQSLLSLSWWGLKNYYLWQPISFLFVQSMSFSGITFFYLISLFFNMYILWILGTALVELVGSRAFLRFYFFCGIVAGMASLLFLALLGKAALFAGAAPAIIAILTAWSMAYPESEILLFFLIPIKAKWIVSGLLAAIILVSLSQWDLSDLVLYLFGIVIGYGYAVIAWGLRSPFPVTQRIDSVLSAISLRLRRYLHFPQWLKFRFFKGKETAKEKENTQINGTDSQSRTSNTSTPSSKIVDISTGKKLSDDDAFIDDMLAKISKHGERSLSWSERRRMQQISERKRKGQDK